MVKEEIWEKISFVTRAKNRKIVLQALTTPSTPSSIQRKTKLSLNTSSRAMRELYNEGLIELKTPKLKVGRIYILTKLGEKVLNSL